jgi:pyruvate/2-oxoglutarate dehydrogenase complex dihydrolipoamide acyltransferase (E2) component
MTLTLSIGSIDKKLVLQDGKVVERDVIHLNLNVDHDIIDGAPLMRFVHRLKKLLLEGPSSAPSADVIVPLELVRSEVRPST